MHRYHIFSEAYYTDLQKKINEFAKNYTIISIQYSTCCNHNTILHSVFITYLTK